MARVSNCEYGLTVRIAGQACGQDERAGVQYRGVRDVRRANEDRLWKPNGMRGQHQ